MSLGNIGLNTSMLKKSESTLISYTLHTSRNKLCAFCVHYKCNSEYYKRLIIKGLACQIKNYITQVTSRPVGRLYLLELVYMIIKIEQYEEHN